MMSSRYMYKRDQVLCLATLTTRTVSHCQPKRTLTPPPKLWSLVQPIPPERVGLNGEYDHRGLEKRAKRALSQSFQPTEIADLVLSQRGRVLVLQGRVDNQSLLDRMLNILMQVNGVDVVESRYVAIAALG